MGLIMGPPSKATALSCIYQKALSHTHTLLVSHCLQMLVISVVLINCTIGLHAYFHLVLMHAMEARPAGAIDPCNAIIGILLQIRRIPLLLATHRLVRSGWLSHRWGRRRLAPRSSAGRSRLEAAQHLRPPALTIVFGVGLGK